LLRQIDIRVHLQNRVLSIGAGLCLPWSTRMPRSPMPSRSRLGRPKGGSIDADLDVLNEAIPEDDFENLKNNNNSALSRRCCLRTCCCCFSFKRFIGLGANLKVDSRGGFYISSATRRIVVSPLDSSLPVAGGVVMARQFTGWLCLVKIFRDVPVYGASCPRLWGEMPLFMGRNVPVYGGVQIEMSLFMGNGRWRRAATCG